MTKHFDFMFTRFNLDPDNKWPDERLWGALESVQMKETVQAMPEQLGKYGGSYVASFMVRDGFSKFSGSGNKFSVCRLVLVL